MAVKLDDKSLQEQLLEQQELIDKLITAAELSLTFVKTIEVRVRKLENMNWNHNLESPQ